VVKVGETYYMFYAATGTERGDAHIGLATATSPEGPWRRYPENPIFAPAPDGSWDDYSVSQPRVYRFGERYYMFYNAQQEEWRGGHFPWRIGLATAPSPEGPWVRYSDRPILDVGALGEWDGLALNLGAVVRVGDEYWLWYAAFKEHPDEYGHIGLARAPAPEGPWRKSPANPLMAPPSWGPFSIQEPWVIHDGTLFHMWYAGMPVIGDSLPADIGYAFSRDGIQWTHSPANPVLKRGERGSWDDYDVSEPVVLVEGGQLYLFYTGFNYPSFASAIGLAVGEAIP
jgi:predicted GH43/DUF377 family glycosyl hydrolase